MSLLTVSWCRLLMGYGALTLLYFTASATQSLQISQKPRFYGVMSNRKLGINCMSSVKHTKATWYRASTYNATIKSPIRLEERIFTQNSSRVNDGILILKDIKVEDQGVYFCKINDVYGPGTEVQVSPVYAGPVNPDNFLYRSQVKDGLMILQGLLLALVIAVFGFRKKTLSEKEDAAYEEPEVDHIYEGLAIETCEGADLYEEISVYAQAEGTEAPWE